MIQMIPTPAGARGWMLDLEDEAEHESPSRLLVGYRIALQALAMPELDGVRALSAEPARAGNDQSSFEGFRYAIGTIPKAAGVSRGMARLAGD